MKANELMIGDWVLILNSTHKEKVFAQVDAIEEGQHSILVTRECSNWFVDIDWIQPIPLTPEILEKNGFERALQISDVEPFDVDEEGNKHYSYNKTFWGWFQPDNIFCIPANGMGWLYIKYVHQLQHALRLCEIEKEIIL